MAKHVNLKRTWTPFERHFAVGEHQPDRLAFIGAQANGEIEFWSNNLYHVEVVHAEHVPTAAWWKPRMVWLSIRRLERCRLPRDWRDLQRIKNEILGPEREACELFPAESRLNDEADQFHLWAFADERMYYPFGYADRVVREADADDGRTSTGGSQRPFEFESHHEPVERCTTCAKLPEYCRCSLTTGDQHGNDDEPGGTPAAGQGAQGEVRDGGPRPGSGGGACAGDQAQRRDQHDGGGAGELEGAGQAAEEAARQAALDSDPQAVQRTKVMLLAVLASAALASAAVGWVMKAVLS